ncbi:DUF1822 family protein [Microcoleus sp. B13-B6]
MNIPNYQYDYEDGNTVIKFEGNYEIIDALLQLQESGELEKILEVTVLDIDTCSQIEQDESSKSITMIPNQVNLTQWFQNTFTAGWQTVEELLTPQQLRPAYFSEPVKRAKRINLQIDLITHTVILLVSLTREDAERVIVNLKVFPTADIPHLPPDLQLILLVEGEIFKEITSRSADQYIQYEFEAEPGDELVVNLVLGEAEITEDFVV